MAVVWFKPQDAFHTDAILGCKEAGSLVMCSESVQYVQLYSAFAEITEASKSCIVMCLMARLAALRVAACACVIMQVCYCNTACKAECPSMKENKLIARFRLTVPAQGW